MKYEPGWHWQERDFRKVLDKAGPLCPSTGMTTQQHESNLQSLCSHTARPDLFSLPQDSVHSKTWTVMWFLDKYKPPSFVVQLQCSKAL